MSDGGPLKMGDRAMRVVPSGDVGCIESNSWPTIPRIVSPPISPVPETA